MADTVGQGFDEPLFDALTAIANRTVCTLRQQTNGALFRVGFNELPIRHLGHGGAIQDDLAIHDLDRVTRQADQAFDIVGAIGRVTEYHDIPALRLGGEQAALNRAHGERAGILRIAIGHFVDEQEIANQQRVFHRPRWDPEGLKEQRAEHTRNQQGINNCLDGFDDTAVVICFRRHNLSCH